MSFSKRIFVGLFLGLLVGLFFGELVLPLKVVAEGFVKLLQMTVLPYMTVSIISSLGSLSIQEAKTLGLRAGVVLVGLWMIGLIFCFLFPIVFPHMQTASFFSTSLIEKPSSFDLVGLYIPSNPFNSLANSVVPAVVLFSLLLGIALIGVERKQVLLDVLKVASQAISRVTRFVVSLTPYGMFAIAATVAGTLSLEQMGRIQMYIVIYMAVALLLTLWVLPGLVSCFTTIRTGEILSATRDALVVAFMAGDLLIVLPTLTEMTETILKRHEPEDPQSNTLPQIIIPASFNFPHIGKLLSLSFILFAAWFTNSSVPIAQYPRLALTGLVTFFGNLNAAVPFLLDLFRIPADTYQLFLATAVINSRFGTLLAVMHTVVIALLGSTAVAGKIKWQPLRVGNYAIVTLVLLVVVFGGSRLLFRHVLNLQYHQDEVLMNMKLLMASPPSEIFKTLPPVSDTSLPAAILDRIRSRNAIRVGIEPTRIPYSFYNRRGELVGLDVEMAHTLASELGVRAEFMPIHIMKEMEQRLSDGTCDIIMSGVAVTTRRAAQTNFSIPYLDETMAFVVPDYLRNEFVDWDTVRRKGSISIGVPNLPYYLDKMHQQLPQAKLVPIDDISYIFSSSSKKFEVAVLGAERASAYSLLHPQYSVVIPGPEIFKISLAYPLAGRDQYWVNFINTWIRLKQNDRTIDTLYDHWILGKNSTPFHPRWSIIRNVLGWIK
jgi:Na+/H+-dicarboxylate symporter/ABC-type amino acid transport substrate-binding protein